MRTLPPIGARVQIGATSEHLFDVFYWTVGAPTWRIRLGGTQGPFLATVVEHMTTSSVLLKLDPPLPAEWSNKIWYIGGMELYQPDNGYGHFL